MDDCRCRPLCVQVMGFATNMPEIMAACDCIITKVRSCMGSCSCQSPLFASVLAFYSMCAWFATRSRSTVPRLPYTSSHKGPVESRCTQSHPPPHPFFPAGRPGHHCRVHDSGPARHPQRLHSRTGKWTVCVWLAHCMWMVRKSMGGTVSLICVMYRQEGGLCVDHPSGYVGNANGCDWVQG